MKKYFIALLILLTTTIIPACGGGGGGGGGTTPPGGTYGITGTVTLTGAGLSGVTLSLNNGSTTTTDSNGNFSFSGLANGVYTVTPARTGYTFNPVNRVATLSGADAAAVNFTATAAAATYSLSGRITVTGTGAGLQNATLTLNTLATAITNANGDYTFTGLANGSYTVTPSHASHTFTPVNMAQNISGANATGVDFVATPAAIPTKSIVKFSTSATSTLIGAVDIRIALPAGATVKTSGTATVDPGSAFASGNAATGSGLFLATYTAASGINPGTVHAMIGSTAGFASGEFLTLIVDLAGGVTPAASEYIVQSLTVYGVDTQAIPGMTAPASSALQGGGTPTKARLKLVTAGTTTTISGVDVLIKLPAGVTLASTVSPPATDPGVVFASGNAVSNSFTVGNYDAINKTVHVSLINAFGFAPGEFAVVMCDLTGVTPVAADFIIQSATLFSPNGSASIGGATVDRTVTLE